jgi:hypothetical protein
LAYSASTSTDAGSSSATWSRPYSRYRCPEGPLDVTKCRQIVSDSRSDLDMVHARQLCGSRDRRGIPLHLSHKSQGPSTSSPPQHAGFVSRVWFPVTVSRKSVVVVGWATDQSSPVASCPGRTHVWSGEGIRSSVPLAGMGRREWARPRGGDGPANSESVGAVPDIGAFKSGVALAWSDVDGGDAADAVLFGGGGHGAG